MCRMKYICPQDVCILEALRTLFPQSSANTLRSWIKAGRISVNSRTVFRANLELSKGAIIEVGPKVSFIDKQIKVFYEDEELIVIEKPQGLLSVATDYDKSHSLHALLKKRFHKQRVFPVHRLDRETSGVMLFAYSDYARQHLKEQFATRCVEKTYYAIVSGTLSPQKGVWESYLQEDPSYHVIEGGERLAITHYEILAAKKDYKLLALKPITGRKHQSLWLPSPSLS